MIPAATRTIEMALWSETHLSGSSAGRQLAIGTRNRSMKMATRSILIGLMMLLFAGASSGQDSLSHGAVFPGGITVEYGLGKYSVRDEYISGEKYSGTLPSLQVKWSRFHDTYGYYFGLEYRNSARIENYNVSADITQVSLSQGYLYPLTKTSLFSRDVYLLLGPSMEFYFFRNEQNIAVQGFDYSQSLAALLSLGATSEIVYPIRRRFQAEGSLRLSILSMGVRMVDEEEDDESPVRLLTLLSGTNASLRLGVRYHLLSSLSSKLSYRFDVTRISSWDPLLSASDNVLLGLTYEF